MFKVPEKFRIKKGEYGTDKAYGNNGQFLVKILRFNTRLLCHVSDGLGWGACFCLIKSQSANMG